MSYLKQITTLITLLIITWFIFFLNLFLPIDLNNFGLASRSVGGLIGIFTMPFLHNDLWHLISNSIPFIILSILLTLFHQNRYINLLIEMVIITGLMIWVFSPGGRIHIGASGVIFSMASFLICAGVFNKSIWQIIGGVITSFFYGIPILMGLIPLRENISYSGHWFGFLTGILLAFFHSYFEANHRK